MGSNRCELGGEQDSRGSHLHFFLVILFSPMEIESRNVLHDM